MDFQQGELAMSVGDDGSGDVFPIKVVGNLSTQPARKTNSWRQSVHMARPAGEARRNNK